MLTREIDLLFFVFLFLLFVRPVSLSAQWIRLEIIILWRKTNFESNCFSFLSFFFSLLIRFCGFFKLLPIIRSCYTYKCIRTYIHIYRGCPKKFGAKLILWKESFYQLKSKNVSSKSYKRSKIFFLIDFYADYNEC